MSDKEGKGLPHRLDPTCLVTQMYFHPDRDDLVLRSNWETLNVNVTIDGRPIAIQLARVYTRHNGDGGQVDVTLFTGRRRTGSAHQ